MISKKILAIKQSKELMNERYEFIANDYKFIIRPIFLGEEDLFMEEFKFYGMLAEKKTDDNQKKILMLQLFSKSIKKAIYNDNEVDLDPYVKLKIFKRFFGNKKIYSNIYKDMIIEPLIKWIEKKITIKGKKIKFYELERKYGLNKLEIYDLLYMFIDISNFPTSLQEKR